jgi:hypothetical protein
MIWRGRHASVASAVGALLELAERGASALQHASTAPWTWLQGMPDALHGPRTRRHGAMSGRSRSNRERPALPCTLTPPVTLLGSK